MFRLYPAFVVLWEVSGDTGNRPTATGCYFGTYHPRCLRVSLCARAPLLPELAAFAPRRINRSYLGVFPYVDDPQGIGFIIAFASLMPPKAP